MRTIENICARCTVMPCVTNGGECTGPLTEADQKAINSAIIYTFEHDIAKARLLSPELVRAALNNTLISDEFGPDEAPSIDA